MKKNKLILLAATTCLGLVTFAEVSNATANAKTVKFEKVKTKKTTKKAKKLTKFDKKELKWRKKLAKGDNDNNTSSTNTDQNQSSKVVNGYDETNGKVINMDVFINTVTQTSFNKLNSFRQSQGLQPLTEDSDLTKIAQLRAKQVAEIDWSTTPNVHYDSNGNRMSGVAAKELGLNNYQDTGGENVGQYINEEFETAIDLGNKSVQDAIDEGPTGGHYKNDVDPIARTCGIGFYVTKNGTIGYALEIK